jgi:hypothetical protein
MTIDISPDYPANLQREKGPNDSVMEVMGREGDVKVMWDKHNTDEVDAAKSQFDKLTKEKRFLAFKVNKDGTNGDQIREFDPNLERIILVPPMVGG